MGVWLITAVEATDPAAVRDVRDILEAYHDDLVATIGETTLTAELATLPAPYVPPDGALLLARNEEGRAAGCVGIKRLSETDCEIKRLYVVEDVRRAGLGRALVRAAIDQARAMGYRVMFLLAVADTTSTAQRLYRGLGFEPTGQFRDTPLGWDPSRFVFMRRAL